jgi:hypothetical protein
MTPRRRRASIIRLVSLIVLLLLAMWVLHRIFIDIPPAPEPEVTQGAVYPAPLT